MAGKPNATSFKKGNKTAVGNAGNPRPCNAAVVSVIKSLNEYVYNHPKPKRKGQQQLPPERLPDLVTRTIAEGVAARTIQGRPTGTTAKFVEIYLERVHGRAGVAGEDHDPKKSSGRLITKLTEAQKAHAEEALRDIKDATRQLSPAPEPLEEA